MFEMQTRVSGGRAELAVACECSLALAGSGRGPGPQRPGGELRARKPPLSMAMTSQPGCRRPWACRLAAVATRPPVL